MNERFLPYLNELRMRLLWSSGALLLTTTLAFVFAPQALHWLERPLFQFLPAGAPLVFTGLGDKFMLLFKVAFLFGCASAFPVLLWHAWQFFRTALSPEDRGPVLVWFIASFVLFIGGMGLAYFVVLPQAIRFLLEVGGDIATPMLTLKDYIDFTVTFLLVCGILFQTPIVIALLSRFGVLSPASLRGRRGYVFMALALAVAVLTPSGDAFTMLAVLVPLYGLFEVSLVLARK